MDRFFLVLMEQSLNGHLFLSGVPQGHCLGSVVVFLIHNDIPVMVDIDSEICLFADDCVCYRQIHSIEDTVKLQRDIKPLG